MDSTGIGHAVHDASDNITAVALVTGGSRGIGAAIQADETNR